MRVGLFEKSEGALTVDYLKLLLKAFSYKESNLDLVKLSDLENSVNKIQGAFRLRK